MAAIKMAFSSVNTPPAVECRLECKLGRTWLHAAVACDQKEVQHVEGAVFFHDVSVPRVHEAERLGEILRLEALPIGGHEA